ncbi:MAG: hypothetical protein JW797_14665 [Bradymonadales bacterium]|nr:hypothetical protein [Bradymonadales bacterium]
MSINSESQAHRAQPVDFALKVLAELFGHYMTPDQSYGLWEEQLRTAMWYADDALFCLRELLANPPENLAERLRQAAKGTLVLGNHPGMEGQDHTDDQVLHWIARVTDQLEERFQQNLLRQTPKTIDETDIQFADTAQEAIDNLLAQVPFWATDITSEADSASDEWGEGAWSVHLRYTLPYP